MRLLSASVLLTLVLTGGLAPAQESLPRLEDWSAGSAKATAPVAVVVHGINPTPGDLDPLTRDLSARGYRAFQFHYDSHQGLRKSAAQLERALLPLVGRSRRLVVVAHSMGGLVSRRALTQGRAGGLGSQAVRIQLVTIAAPFGGFWGANFARLDFGIGPDSHDDLGTRAKFIRRPGALAGNVTHVKIETTERKQNRILNGKRRSDDKISTKNQRQKLVDREATWRHPLVAGHVGSIRTDDGKVPVGLGRLLDMHLGSRITPQTFARRLEALVARLRKLTQRLLALQRRTASGAARGLSASDRQ